MGKRERRRTRWCMLNRIGDKELKKLFRKRGDSRDDVCIINKKDSGNNGVNEESRQNRKGEIKLNQ